MQWMNESEWMEGHIRNDINNEWTKVNEWSYIKRSERKWTIGHSVGLFSYIYWFITLISEELSIQYNLS